ncbi:hypothetical protein EOD41_04965 [Mucilaginibacter limnophilus]|uniref:Uncharacterized protein n=1 Tax=Mucilaginibacter limnophilus TaxID=1932778 RepID=A0A437MUH2_9SPHI|nr:hypothetical protein [Mucilaginibacter limnophilus]RVU01318.1 hypothetical protein EOD41_04965 [Mucilaginibacter limnophilus]
MKIHLSTEATPLAKQRLDQVISIDANLKKELSDKNYGEGIKEIFVVLNSYDPVFSSPPKDFETGIVVQKSFSRRYKTLSVTVKINYATLVKADEKQVSSLIKDAIIIGFDEIKCLPIKKFDMEAFYEDVNTILCDERWVTHPEDYQPEPFDYQVDFNNKLWRRL